MKPGRAVGAWAGAAVIAAGASWILVVPAAAVPRETPAPDEPRLDPPTARLDLHESLRAELGRPRHPSDGQGRAWLVDPEPAVAGEPGRWTIVFEAGPDGIAEGGTVTLQVSPFWGWDTPQPYAERLAGYTTVSTVAPGIELVPEVEAVGPGSTSPLVVGIEGRALAGGERLEFVYGAGPDGARADRYAERGSRFWIWVDGNGDGSRDLLADSPSVDVRAGEPARLLVIAPSTAEVGATVQVRVVALDAAGNAGCRAAGRVRLSAGPGLRLPEGVDWPAEGEALVLFDAVVESAGILRIEAGWEELEARSNPLVAGDGASAVLWGDLHGHSQLSDGTGTAEDYLAYARDSAGLDVVALTDHDHWGFLKLDEHPEVWQHIVEATLAAHEPGRFVTLVGYEWTNWVHGHRHVLDFGAEGGLPLLSSLDEAADTPAELWDALAGRPVLTFAHHSAGGPVATNWSFPPDPVLEPVTEVVSVHGSSEALDSPLLIYDPVPGNFVRDVLDRGYRLGLVGSGDSHDGHPGHAHLGSPEGSGGLVALVGAEHTRESVLACLRARRVYATSGPRIVLRAVLAGRAMGAVVPPGAVRAAPELRVAVHGTAPLLRLDLVRSGAVEQSHAAGGAIDLYASFDVADPQPGEYLYLRVLQEDGGAAWSSPFFLEDPPP